MELKITHLDGVRFEVQARDHKIICDQPADNGGEDAGMTPPELLLASLGSCAAYYVVQYLKTRNLAQNGVGVTVTAEKLRQPGRLGNFRIVVQCPVELTPEQSAALMRSVHHCTIHNTLVSSPHIEIELQTAAHAAVPFHATDNVT